jgi:hypothetical protein
VRRAEGSEKPSWACLTACLLRGSEGVVKSNGEGPIVGRHIVLTLRVAVGLIFAWAKIPTKVRSGCHYFALCFCHLQGKQLPSWGCIPFATDELSSWRKGRQHEVRPGKSIYMNQLVETALWMEMGRSENFCYSSFAGAFEITFEQLDCYFQVWSGQLRYRFYARSYLSESSENPEICIYLVTYIRHVQERVGARLNLTEHSWQGKTRETTKAWFCNIQNDDVLEWYLV